MSAMDGSSLSMKSGSGGVEQRYKPPYNCRRRYIMTARRLKTMASAVLVATTTRRMVFDEEALFLLCATKGCLTVMEEMGNLLGFVT